MIESKLIGGERYSLHYASKDKFFVVADLDRDVIVSIVGVDTIKELRDFLDGILKEEEG